jgi:hypothetical protein
MKYLLSSCFLFVCAISFVFLGVQNVYAEDLEYSGVSGPTGTGQYESAWQQQSGGGTGVGSGKLQNPLKVSTIEELLRLILDVLVIFAVPIIVFFLIYSGFLYVMAQGKPDKIKTATTAFTWTIIGGVIVLGASVILTVITNTVKSLQ